ncbi:ExeM/NucH family extracellular endonuclease [Caenimonas sp. SL110]|uniref:ExeM/NucH family extracellular endonuclease n=1 Tax=Caenimonas sp. SL110 TaxID=1450524 RepID=UPI00069CE013|nr:ExeM/NucH family extracellular endonuclease [Caenimonas sp. SL110]
MSADYFDLASGNFSQDWTNAGLITANDSWTGVPSIVGYLGDYDAGTLVDVNAQAVTGAMVTVDVIANQANPSTLTSGGVAEFAITNPVVALQGSGTADAPNLVIYLNATGRESVTVSYLLRDVDGAVDNAVQQVALQYRIGGTGSFVNVPAAYVADATTGPSVATQTNSISVVLPAEVNGQAQVEVRIITTNATGSDEWVGIDDISVTSSPTVAPVAVQTFTPNASTTEGSSDASTALALDASWMVVADDEANVLRVYPRSGGPAVAEWSYETNGPMLAGELDLEGGTRIGDTLYFTGSHSNTKSGGEDNAREAIFAVTVSGTGAATQFNYVGKFTGLEAALATWDSSNAHALGANYFGFTASAAAGVVPEGVNGFSIEGLTASQDGTQLFIAFRAPQADGVARTDALIVPVNLAGLLEGSPVFGAPFELDLGGRGIRSIEKAATGGDYLIVAGPAAGATSLVTHDFRIFRWDGTSSTATQLDVNLDALRDTTGGSFESIVEVQSTAQGTLVQLLQDNGDTIWAGQTLVSKDLAPGLQQFQGNWVTLGANVTDTAAPVLAGTSPSTGSATVGVAANIVLQFDEGVVRGTGNFVIRKAADDSIVETISVNAANVAFNYNAVTINPSANLLSTTAYYVHADNGAVMDHAGNAWTGLANTSFNFTTSPPPRLLITELNSNSAGGDFFELYNYGTTPIDLTGWKWDDDSANFNDAAAASFASGTTLAAGQKMIVVNTADAAAFRTSWGSLSDGIKVVATGGPGLGGSPGDAVAVFDAGGLLVASLSYKSTTITASDGSTISAAVRADGNALVAGHAGISVGATATTSIVWSEQSVDGATYKAAAAGQLGGFAAGSNVGSPGAPAGAGVTTPYTESFSTTLGDFTVFSVDADAARTWTRSSATSTAEVNGFGDSAPANDWLISRGFDLTKTDVEYLSFTTFTNFADAAGADPELRVLWSSNYSGSGTPSAATWTELSYTPSPTDSETITPSGLINLSAITGNNVFFAFQYTSSGTAGDSASLWRVDDVKIEGYDGAVMSIAAADASKPEGDSGSRSFSFTVTRAGDVSGTSSANWAVSGSAVSAADFGGTLPSGTVNFGASETVKTITVNVTGDLDIEASEAFTVTLSGAAGASLVQATAVGTIVTDDVLVTKISAVQGSGTASAMAGQSGVTIEGVVTAWMPNLKGFYVQEEAADVDGNAATSEGVFVFYGNTVPAGLTGGTVGDIVRVTGSVAEFSGVTEMTTLTGFSVVTDHSGAAMLPAAMGITLPQASQVNWEAVEGMLVSISSASDGGKLVVTDNFNLARYGQVTLTSDELIATYSETHAPSTSGYAAWLAQVQGDQIILDDGNSAQNPDPLTLGRGGNPLTAANTLRAGDWVQSVTGVVDQFASGSELGYETTYRIHSTTTVNFQGDARPTVDDIPDAIANAEIKIASANVLNYFTTLGSANFTTPNGTTHEGRGANNALEFDRQQDKIVANLLSLDADVVGLMEMQNNGFADGSSAIDSLVDALNAIAGAGTYAYISGAYIDGNGAPAPTAGDDAIMVAIVYKPASVTPVGSAAVPDVTDPAWDAFTATYGSRVPVAQTFRSNADDEIFTVVVNHFKSKGSVIDPDIGDGQGANNLARMEAAQQLTAWLATNPTGTADSDVLLIGDLNAYGMEDPITYLEANGYDKVSTGYSYSFDGLWGSLDHALSSDSLTGQVAGTYKWGINAQEPGVLDYNTEFKSTTQDSLFYSPDAYRSSDHNPILIGLNLDSGTVISGTSDDDFLLGDIGSDTLEGGSGRDTIDGGAGIDSMAGGSGNDRFIVREVGDEVIEFEAEGKDTVYSYITYTLGANVEKLILLGDGDIAGTGNAGPNRIDGNSGDNELRGGGGRDTLRGGEGDDSYFVDGSPDRVEELEDAGHDTVYSSAQSVDLARNVEDLVLVGGGVEGIGNKLDNWLQGNDLDNVLQGRQGDDTIDGGAGADRLSGGRGSDLFSFSSGSGIDVVTDFDADDRILLEMGLNKSAIATPSQALAATSYEWGNAVIDLGGGNYLTLLGVAQGELNPNSFMFEVMPG